MQQPEISIHPLIGRLRRINNAGTEYQNPTPALLIVVILFSNHRMPDCQLGKRELISFL